MIKPTTRVSKKTGEVSYLLRVNLGFVNGEQIIKWKCQEKCSRKTPKMMDVWMLKDFEAEWSVAE